MESEHENSPPALVAALTAAQSLARPINVGDTKVPAAVVPEGYNLVLLEKALPQPTRPRGWFPTQTQDAFLKAVRLATTMDVIEGQFLFPVFFARDGIVARATAVLNFPTWRDFGVVLNLKLSTPFLDWYRLNGNGQTQRAFALFLEERTAHVVRPEGAALLELARKFKANVTVRYQSVIENENGDQALEFMQTTEAGSAAAKSRMKVPASITLFMPVWNGSEPVKFEARFGYDISAEGKLELKFEILRLDELLADELRRVVAVLGKELPSSVLIEGENAVVPAL